jgi:hypothetical protein
VKEFTLVLNGAAALPLMLVAALSHIRLIPLAELGGLIRIEIIQDLANVNMMSLEESQQRI